MLDQIIRDLITADRQDSRHLTNGARLTWWPTLRLLVAGRAAGNMGDEAWAKEASKFEEYIERAGYVSRSRKTTKKDGRWMTSWNVLEPVEQGSLFEQEGQQNAQ
jgi:hypothetical protein